MEGQREGMEAGGGCPGGQGEGSRVLGLRGEEEVGWGGVRVSRRGVCG